MALQNVSSESEVETASGSANSTNQLIRITISLFQITPVISWKSVNNSIGMTRMKCNFQLPYGGASGLLTEHLESFISPYWVRN